MLRLAVSSAKRERKGGEEEEGEGEEERREALAHFRRGGQGALALLLNEVPAIGREREWSKTTTQAGTSSYPGPIVRGESGPRG